MIFSVSHHSSKKKSAGEIRFPYNQSGVMFDFIKENKNKRYNIIAINCNQEKEVEKAIEQADFIRAVTANYTVECGDVKMLRILLDRGYNAYLRYPVSDWETYQELLNLGVSDIYIDGPLGFSCDLIESSKGTTKIRVSPTVSANSALSSERPISSFFIRPEDLDLYNDVVDVIDFHVPGQDQEDALFDIYNRGTFNYDLGALIPGIQRSDINNLLIEGDFAEVRFKCQQKCKIPGYRCNYCAMYMRLLDLAQKAVKN